MTESCQRACYKKCIVEQRAKHISKVIKNTNLVGFIRYILQTEARNNVRKYKFCHIPCVSTYSSPLLFPVLHDFLPGGKKRKGKKLLSAKQGFDTVLDEVK